MAYSDFPISWFGVDPVRNIRQPTVMMRFAIPMILFGASISFALGLVLPIAEFKRLYMFTDNPSLLDIIWSLWNEGDLLIAAIVALFSVAFPAAKLLVLHIAAHIPEKMRWVERVGILSKWSMADVLIVALAIFAAKTSGLATAATKPGIWFYAAATLLSAIAAIILTRQTDGLKRTEEE